MKMLPLRAAIAAALLSVAVGVSAKPWWSAPKPAPKASTWSSTQPQSPPTPWPKPSSTAWRLQARHHRSDSGAGRTWDISDDGLSYTFHLRKGVKFHTTEYFKPTRDMNADDVVWSFQRQLDPNHPWHKLSSVGFPYFESMGFKELLKSVEKSTTTRSSSP
jgi:dipeptide transport system substrate-binding protein